MLAQVQESLQISFRNIASIRQYCTGGKGCTDTDTCIIQHVTASPAQPDNQEKPACGVCKADVGLQERPILAYGGSHSPADGPPVRVHPDERIQV